MTKKPTTMDDGTNTSAALDHDSTASLKKHQEESSAMDSLSADRSTMKKTTTNAALKKDSTDDIKESSSSGSATTENGNDTSITCIFGELNATTVADYLSNRLEQAFQSNMTQLPMLRQTNIPVLLQRLRHSYFRHVDILEVYCSRNLFTLDMFPSKRLRQRIIQHYNEIKHSSNVEFPPPIIHHNADNNDNNNKNIIIHSLSLPSDRADNDGNPPPSGGEKDIMALQDEMKSLRQRLDQAQKTRLDLMRSLEELAKAEQLASMAMATTADDDVGKLHDSMTAVAVGAQGLLLYDQQGRDHLEHNNSKGNDDNDNDENNDEGGVLMSDNAWNCMLMVGDMNKNKTHALSILEQYQQEKAVVTSSNDDFVKVQQLILGSTNTSST